MHAPVIRRAAVLAFSAVFFGGQAALIVASYVRGDRLFGYQMFAESTFFTAHLFRVTADGRREHLPSGTWAARDGEGKVHRYRWSAFVDDFRLDRLERRTRAKIGIEVTLKFFGAALDYVAERIPDDGETDRLELVVEYETAGGEKREVRLRSRARLSPEAVP